MLDIIIPCYNAKETLSKTLDSIKEQKTEVKFNVYLVNDKSDYNYQDEVKEYSKFFPIEEIELKKNLGPGGARREGINHTKSDYIMFIDSDDVLYNDKSLDKLYNTCKNHDLCISNFILERDGVKVEKERNNVWLHGKMYRRSFLEKYNINFNDTRANEDNGFNRLIILMKPDKVYLDEPTYIYRENPSSITRSNNRSYKIYGLEGYIYNMKWAIDEALKRGADSFFVPYLTTSTLISMYYDYLYNIKCDNVDLILKYSKKLLPYYLDYEKVPEDKFRYLNDYKVNDMKQEKKEYEIVISFDEFIEKVKNY